jgi:hypothetical protein
MRIRYDSYSSMRHEVLAVVKMSMLDFWAVTPCGLMQISIFQQYVPLKLWYLPISPHDIATQKININLLILGCRVQILVCCWKIKLVWVCVSIYILTLITQNKINLKLKIIAIIQETSETNKLFRTQ